MGQNHRLLLLNAGRANPAGIFVLSHLLRAEQGQ
jgi:hypothetical protein